MDNVTVDRRKAEGVCITCGKRPPKNAVTQFDRRYVRCQECIDIAKAKWATGSQAKSAKRQYIKTTFNVNDTRHGRVIPRMVSPGPTTKKAISKPVDGWRIGNNYKFKAPKDMAVGIA